jgi:hypothetical protein
MLPKAELKMDLVIRLKVGALTGGLLFLGGKFPRFVNASTRVGISTDLVALLIVENANGIVVVVVTGPKDPKSNLAIMLSLHNGDF